MSDDLKGAERPWEWRLVEPSAAEIADLPETTAFYLSALEASYKNLLVEQARLQEENERLREFYEADKAVRAVGRFNSTDAEDERLRKALAALSSHEEGGAEHG